MLRKLVHSFHRLDSGSVDQGFEYASIYLMRNGKKKRPVSSVLGYTWRTEFNAARSKSIKTSVGEFAKC